MFISVSIPKNISLQIVTTLTEKVAELEVDKGRGEIRERRSDDDEVRLDTIAVFQHIHPRHIIGNERDLM